MLFTIASILAMAGTTLAARCNHDNLLRCLISASATEFCGSYIHISTVYETIGTVTVSEVDTFTTTTTTTTTTTDAAQAMVTAHALESSVSKPKCLFVHTTPYPAARLTSACVCLLLPTSTIHVTATTTATSAFITTMSTTTTAAPTQSD